MAASALELPVPLPPAREQPPQHIQWQGILTKELRGRMRGIRAFLVLSGYLLLLTLFTLFIYFIVKVAAGTSATVPVGKIVFLSLAALQLAMVCFLAPSFTAGLVAGEREQQTYDLLMTTPTPLFVIIGAKLIAALAYIFLLIVAALPLMSIALFLGGVAPEEVLVALVLLVATALICGATGLFFSSLLRSTIGAAALAYGTLLLPIVALPIVSGIVFSVLGALVSSATSSSSQNTLVLYYAGGFIYSLNPFIAGGMTEAIIIANKPLWFYTMQLPGASSTVLVVGPWLIYTLMSLLVSAVLFLLSLYFARPTRYVGRRAKQ